MLAGTFALQIKNPALARGFACMEANRVDFRRMPTSHDWGHPWATEPHFLPR